jgi:hypothetical protein
MVDRQGESGLGIEAQRKPDATVAEIVEHGYPFGPAKVDAHTLPRSVELVLFRGTHSARSLA